MASRRTWWKRAIVPVLPRGLTQCLPPGMSILGHASSQRAPHAHREMLRTDVSRA